MKTPNKTIRACTPKALWGGRKYCCYGEELFMGGGTCVILTCDEIKRGGGRGFGG